jgi:hypothetical protein
MPKSAISAIDLRLDKNHINRIVLPANPVHAY